MAHIVTLTGPSGVGKSTLLRYLLSNNPHLLLLGRCVTKPQQPYDVLDEYWYCTLDEFEELSAKGLFLSDESWGEYRFGVLQSVVDEALATDRTYLMVLTVTEVVRLHTYLKRLGKEDALQSYFVKPWGAFPELTLYRNLRRRGARRSDALRRAWESSQWEAQARRTGLFQFVRNRPAQEAEQRGEFLAALVMKPE